MTCAILFKLLLHPIVCNIDMHAPYTKTNFNDSLLFVGQKGRPGDREREPRRP